MVTRIRLLALALLAATAYLVAWSCSAVTPDPEHCIGPLTAYERATCEP